MWLSIRLYACMCVSIFLIPPLLCSLYTCCPLRKSPGFEPPGEGEAVSRVSSVWAVSVMAIQAWNKKPSLSLSSSSNAICSLRAKHKQRIALFRKIIEDRTDTEHDSLCHVCLPMSNLYVIDYTDIIYTCTYSTLTANTRVKQ